MHPPISRRALVAAFALLAGCARTGGERAGGDMGPCSGAGCPCASDNDCRAGFVCDPMGERCEECFRDRDCPMGTVCAHHRCAAGCAAEQPCGDGSVCEADASVCVECLSDLECRDPQRPRCDAAHRRCQPCQPANDNCGLATYCAPAGDGWACVAGCKDDRDCASVDGGADAAIAGGRCDHDRHQCGRCNSDGDCPLGQICGAGVCTGGCTTIHGCGDGSSCCNGSCVDVTQDVQNCGACGVACSGGWSCCHSNCSNPANDMTNCGGCGLTCAVANGVPQCLNRSCAVGSCHAGFADCNGLYNDGCETDTQTSSGNCGACTHSCAIAHALPKCLAGACQIDTCLFPYADCNNMVVDGCEADVHGGDLMNCGGCNVKCQLPHATPTCDHGVCKVMSCDAGWADCNHDPGDGCEADLNASAANCGGCGMACSFRNAAGSCSGGQCALGPCVTGYGDCNHNPGDGCETNLASEPAHCGACATVCSGANATATCVNSACQITCTAGFDDCNHNPADGCETHLDTDPMHCGACTLPCSGNHIGSPSCAGGLCNGICDANYQDCNNNKQTDGCESSTLSDPVNCGGCGVRCSSTNGAPSCVSASCRIACNPGFGDCDGLNGNGCETDVSSDPLNCGGCKLRCSSINGVATCTNSSCGITCNAGFGDCDHVNGNGCETNLAADSVNCGACGAYCNAINGTATCMNSTCRTNCNAGFGDCDHIGANGCESNLTSDARNCGACGAVCAAINASAKCMNSTCQLNCQFNWADCNLNAADGCEVNYGTDPLNCGGCGHVCSTRNATATCDNYNCILSCKPGYFDCDNNIATGCEVNLTSDLNNCGRCATTCSNINGSPSCLNGSCAIACNAGYADCNRSNFDGCEAYLPGDPANCGRCGNACAVGKTCVNNNCV